VFDEEQMEELRQMSKDALQVKLAELQGDLAEMEEQTLFMLRSTGHHIRGVVRKKHEKKIKELEELVQVVEKELRKR
jgi:ribosomal protein L29